MIFALVILLTALMLSAVAAYYSIAGLTAIFAAAVVPVIIMGATLELGKVVATVWLHNNWKRINLAFKLYLIPAVVFLMLLTSMGIFGFLSKAHSDQSLVSGDAMSKVAIFDEKIATEKENIAQAKKALEQMNSQVDQMLGRTDSERGTERAVSIRRNQAKERSELQAQIAKSQKTIQQLQEERAPLAAEFRKVEAEVGPIKYIAALLYGDNPDQNILERAVRWVIILIVVVFDPLALCLILAGNKQIEWARQGTGNFIHNEEPISKPVVAEPIADINTQDPEPDDDIGYCPKCNAKLIHATGIGPFCPNKECPVVDGVYNEIFFKDDEEPNDKVSSTDFIEKRANEAIVQNATYNFKNTENTELFSKEPVVTETVKEIDESIESKVDDLVVTEGVTQEAYKKVSEGYVEFEGKRMGEHVLKDIRPDLFGLDENGESSFGNKFPEYAVVSDIFVRTDVLPHRVFKFVGNKWIEINKESSDTYLFNNNYIRYLIDKIGTGEIDPEILTSAEQDAIEGFIKKPKG